MIDDPDLLFDTEIRADDPLVRVQRSNSTPATRARAVFLKGKKLGATWTEDGCLCRMGATGVTVFKI